MVISPWSTLDQRVADARARGSKGTVCLLPETCGFCRGRLVRYLMTEDELLKLRIVSPPRRRIRRRV